MNYRHAYHAGNFADVVKHLILVLVIEHLKQKPAPFRVIDTHAGTGLYDLAGEDARRSGEAEAGVLRLMALSDPPRVLKGLTAAVAGPTGIPQPMALPPWALKSVPVTRKSRVVPPAMGPPARRVSMMRHGETGV